MAYDEALAARVRDALAARTEFTEQAMFGGLAFMVNTHMACGAMRDDLMVRVGKENHGEALARGAHEMAFTGRPMRSMVIVPAAALTDAEVLESWVDQAVRFAQSEPPKAPKSSMPRRASRCASP
jgi:TfoX/Sxy family transcriptional regulator of competence genes